MGANFQKGNSRKSFTLNKLQKINLQEPMVEKTETQFFKLS